MDLWASSPDSETSYRGFRPSPATQTLNDLSQRMDDTDLHYDLSQLHSDVLTQQSLLTTTGAGRKALAGRQESVTVPTQSTTASPTNTNVYLRDEDVVLGRRGNHKFHPGNILFRELIADNKMEAQVLVDHVYQKGGRFLEQAKAGDTWTIIQKSKVVERVRRQIMRKQQGTIDKDLVETQLQGDVVSADKVTNEDVVWGFRLDDRFREIVREHMDSYRSSASKQVKTRILRSIMCRIQNNGGRFLQKADDGSMMGLNEEETFAKIKEAMREVIQKAAETQESQPLFESIGGIDDDESKGGSCTRLVKPNKRKRVVGRQRSHTELELTHDAQIRTETRKFSLDNKNATPLDVVSKQQSAWVTASKRRCAAGSDSETECSLPAKLPKIETTVSNNDASKKVETGGGADEETVASIAETPQALRVSKQHYQDNALRKDNLKRSNRQRWKQSDVNARPEDDSGNVSSDDADVNDAAKGLVNLGNKGTNNLDYPLILGDARILMIRIFGQGPLGLRVDSAPETISPRLQKSLGWSIKGPNTCCSVVEITNAQGLGSSSGFLVGDVPVMEVQSTALLDARRVFVPINLSVFQNTVRSHPRPLSILVARTIGTHPTYKTDSTLEHNSSIIGAVRNNTFAANTKVVTDVLASRVDESNVNESMRSLGEEVTGVDATRALLAVSDTRFTRFSPGNDDKPSVLTAAATRGVVPFCRLCNGRPRQRVHHSWCPKLPLFLKGKANKVLEKILLGVSLGCNGCAQQYETGRIVEDLKHSDDCRSASEKDSNKKSKDSQRSTGGGRQRERLDQCSLTSLCSDDKPSQDVVADVQGISSRKPMPVVNTSLIIDSSLPILQSVNPTSIEGATVLFEDTADKPSDKRSRESNNLTAHAKRPPTANKEKAKKATKASANTTEIVASKLQCKASTPHADDSCLNSNSDKYDSYWELDSIGDDKVATTIWEPCENPWGGEREMEKSDVVVYTSLYGIGHHETLLPSRRFAVDPFSTSQRYHSTHKSLMEGCEVVRLKRDTSVSKDWGFDWARHDFGGACLVTSVNDNLPASISVRKRTEIR
jgi:hypothetical protein